MFVNFKPEIWEIQEMLECVALTHNLDDILPVPAGENRAEWMHRGWCFLWYEDEVKNYLPIGYTFFQFTGKYNFCPYFHFAATQFAAPSHIRIAARKMNIFIAREFKNRVRAYISNERIMKFAVKNGFVSTNKKILEKDIHGTAGRRSWQQFSKRSKKR